MKLVSLRSYNQLTTNMQAANHTETTNGNCIRLIVLRLYLNQKRAGSFSSHTHNQPLKS